MNPTIIVQQNYDFSDLVIPANQLPVQPTEDTSKAAVIRPMRPLNVQTSGRTEPTPMGQPTHSNSANKKHGQTGETRSLSEYPLSENSAALPPRSIPVEIRPISSQSPNVPPERSKMDFDSHYHTTVNTTALPDDERLDLLATLRPNQELPLETLEIAPMKSHGSGVIPNFEELTKGIGATPRVALPQSEQPYRSATGSDRANNFLPKAGVSSQQSKSTKISKPLSKHGSMQNPCLGFPAVQRLERQIIFHRIVQIFIDSHKQVVILERQSKPKRKK